MEKKSKFTSDPVRKGNSRPHYLVQKRGGVKKVGRRKKIEGEGGDDVRRANKRVNKGNNPKNSLEKKGLV